MALSQAALGAGAAGDRIRSFWRLYPPRIEGGGRCLPASGSGGHRRRGELHAGNG